jgi:hypothetical protein
MVRDYVSGKNIYLLGDREELDRIESVYHQIKMNLSINKVEIYKKALEWIAKDEKVKIKFIEYLPEEKGQEQQLVISK